MNEIHSLEEFENCMNSNSNTFVFKHSTRCSFSASIFQKVNEFSKKTGTKINLVLVIEDRSLSNKIEEVTEVRHESPQMFIVKGGNVVDSASHTRIDAQYLNNFLEA